MHLETQLATPQPDSPSRAQQASTKPGLLFVLSAPSGTGKDTVIQALKDQGLDFHVVSSVTTRAPRPSESEGKPYYFVNKETFDSLIAQNQLIEFAQVHGNWYGQPIQPIKENLLAGRDVLLKIDVQGAATVRKRVPDAIFIFLVPSSVEELVQRLTDRDTETPAERERRLQDAQNELAQQQHYEYVIENRQGHLSEAVDCLRAIMLAEHCRTQTRSVQL